MSLVQEDRDGTLDRSRETLRTVKAPASHSVSGNVGAGTGHVSVTTMSGAVTLLRRAAEHNPVDDPPGPAGSPSDDGIGQAGMENKTT